MSDGTPFVTIILPIFNEEKYIEECLQSIVDSTWSKDCLEVLVIDGMSTDKTRVIVQLYIDKYPFFRLVNNPRKIKPVALNMGIATSKGDILMRMDGHASYDKNYISKCVYYLEKYNDAWSVGGIRKTLPGDETLTAKAIAIAVSHPFAVGNATYRTGTNTVKRVDILFGFCCHKKTFGRLGGFNEALLRGQDREFNIRLQEAGGKLLLAPDAYSWYYARSNLSDYAKWIYEGGLTPIYISRLTNRNLLSWRNLIPLFFVVSVIFFTILSFFSSLSLLILQSILGSYLLVGCYFSLRVAIEENDYRLVPYILLIFIVTHFAYGYGSFIGIFKNTDKTLI